MSKDKDVLLEFSMSPFDKGESLSAYVSRSLEIIDKSGIDYKLNPMGTVLEGSFEEVMKVVADCFNKMKSDCNRITLSIKMDYRKGATGRLKKKIQSIENKLGKELNK